MNNNGWIKLYRKLLDNPICNKPAWLSLWIHLLLLANHDNGSKFVWNGKEIELKAGQFVTGREVLSRKTGIPESTIEDRLSFLENSLQIRQQKFNKYRLITIVKWKEYQETDNKPTTNRQQTDTFKNVKNIRSKEEENMYAFERFWSIYPKKELKKKTIEIWQRKGLDSHIEVILKFVNLAKETDRWRKGYVKQPPVFLNGECWNDDLASYNDFNKESHQILVKAPSNKYENI
jgi:hypothetical protein